MKILSVIVSVILMFNCSNSGKAKNANVNSAQAPNAISNGLEVNSSTSPETNASPSETASVTPSDTKSDSVSVKIEHNEERNADDILVFVGSEEVGKIETPSFEDVNDFAVDEAKPNEKGFEFTVEYGSRYKYEKTFFFEKNGQVFSLSSIDVKSFDGANPDKSSQKTVKIDPQVSLDKFEISEYLKD
ncbi:MAG: hypothetical protein ACK5NT_01185 [Pyrinomonadaceae bacterium]